MLNIRNAEILKNTQLNSDWTISHVFKNYKNDVGKEYYLFMIHRTGGIATSNIMLEKEATNCSIDLDTMEKRRLYELKGPAGTANVYLSEIQNMDTFINELKKVC